MGIENIAREPAIVLYQRVMSLTKRGKGDHRHIEVRQERYVFKTVELLMADFLANVRRLRGE